ncbi:hypothetical protein HD554DRAFT_2027383, partial [Boletus coccyginus]
ADFAGDVTLVFLSLKLLWGVKLPRRQRRLILSTFASSMVMSMTSLPHAIAQAFESHSLILITGDLEVSHVILSQIISSLIVCNLLVVVTYIYRVYLSSSESEDSSEDDDFTTPAPRSTQSLTTVDLSTLDPTTMGATNPNFRSTPAPSVSAAS